MKIYLSTNNRHKIEEISALLPGTEIVTASDIPNAPKTIEDLPTLEGNALKKAREGYAATGLLSVADDTGLEVYYLELAPGVYSARYAGENATYADNCEKLLHALKGVPPRRRGARFRTVIAVAGKGVELTFDGMVEGMITESPRGTNGFGYDPLFVPLGHRVTYAEMTSDLKNRLSHRALALKKAAEFLLR